MSDEPVTTQQEDWEPAPCEDRLDWLAHYGSVLEEIVATLSTELIEFAVLEANRRYLAEKNEVEG